MVTVMTETNTSKYCCHIEYSMPDCSNNSDYDKLIYSDDLNHIIWLANNYFSRKDVKSVRVADKFKCYLTKQKQFI
jgi:hypothetical protein